MCNILDGIVLEWIIPDIGLHRVMPFEEKSAFYEGDDDTYTCIATKSIIQQQSKFSWKTGTHT